jgi:hypothetical protein
MQRAASAGCPLCIVLIAGGDVNWLPPENQEGDIIFLKRAIMDAQIGMALFIGMDDISHTSFFRVPPEWSKTNIP